MALPDRNYIARLQNAIRQLHHCESKYIESVTISGTLLFFHNGAVEESEVAVFEISDNPEAKRAYAWSCRDGNHMRCVVVLEIPPVSSPQTAFDAATAAQIVNRTFRDLR